LAKGERLKITTNF